VSPRRTRAIARKELLHIVRDPRSLTQALAMPLLMILLFGYALSFDVDRILTFVYDADRTPQSRELISRFQGSRFFEVVGAAPSYAEVERHVDTGECLLGIAIRQGYGREVAAGRSAGVQILIDGSDSNTASIALGYVESVMWTYGSEVRARALLRQTGQRVEPPLEPRLRVWYNSRLESKNYIIPGLIAVILTIIAALLTSLTIAREWETGTMEQLLSTPVRAAELVLGKMSAYFLIGVADMALAILAGLFVFGVPLRGNLLFLALTSFIFLFGALGWGILLSALARSQVLAFQMGLLSSFLPALILSGFIYATQNMPLPIRIVSHLTPARYFVTALKGIFLKGVGPEVLWAELLFLAGYATFIFIAATRRLRGKLV